MREYYMFDVSPDIWPVVHTIEHFPYDPCRDGPAFGMGCGLACGGRYTT